MSSIVGVVGHPIVHSLSPVIHNAALRRDGIDTEYDAFDVAPAAFRSFVERMASEGAKGLNVTVPHKQAACAVSDELSETAERTGAVNTLVFTDHVVGHNTDVAAIRRVLTEMEIDIPGSRVLIIGAGGAGRAGVVALERASEVLVTNRTDEKASRVAELVAAGRSIAWTSLAEAATEVDVIVQATSVGLEGNASVLEPTTLERSRAVVLDLVYGRSETPLVKTAREAGLKATDGLEVLVYQAEGAYELFWGHAPAPGVMMEAALTATGRS